MKKSLNKKLNFIFNLSLGLSFMLLFTPVDWKLGVYGVGILGWFQIICIILSFLLFFILTFIDFKRKAKKEPFNRVKIYLVIILLSLIYWLYQTNKS